MRLRKLAVILAAAGVPVIVAAAQAPAWKPPRTPDGQPDFQGTWVNKTATPLQRPKELAHKPLLSDEEVAELKQRAARLFSGDGDTAPGDELYEALLKNPAKHVTGRSTGDYNQFWTEDTSVVIERRTSQIVDPPNGLLPPLTDQGQRRQAARAAYQREHPADGPEDRSPRERCLSMGPIKVGFGQSRALTYIKIVQTRSAILLYTEANHESRVIPLSDRPHAPNGVRRWLGDSRGKWDGDTLVIDNTNFHPQSLFRIAPTVGFLAERFHTIERLTLLGPETMQYQVTVDDPTTWTRPWTAVAMWQQTSARMFEDACHEGNYGIEGILRGARADERARGPKN